MLKRWENLTKEEKQQILDGFYRKKMEDEARLWEEEQKNIKLENMENNNPMKEITQEWIEEKMKDG